MKTTTLLLLLPAVALAQEPPCTPAAATATVDVSLKKGSKLKDVASWYHRITCRDLEAPLSAADLPLGLAIEGKLPASRAVEVVRAAAASAGYEVREDGRRVVLQKPGEGPAPTEPTSCSLDPEAVSVKGDSVTVDGARAQGFDLDCLLRSVRIVPSVKNGTVQGLKLFSIRRGSALALVGFENGDTVRSINRHALDSPDKVLEVYTLLRNEKLFEVALERRGELKTLGITVK